MRQYETICIVNPDLAEEDYQAALTKSKELIEKQKGVVVKVQEWGKQKLAYLVKKYDKGSYVVFNYCGDAGVSAELERNLKLDDNILKFQTVKLADKADPEELLQKATSSEKAVDKIPEESEETEEQVSDDQEEESEVENGEE